MFENPSVPSAFALGIVLCICVISYAEWLSHRLLVCPEWTINCEIGAFVKWNLNNIAITQGIATVFFSAGLAILAYSAQCISEALLWPLLKTQPFSLEGIDKYLNIVRGSITLMFSTSDIALTAYSRFVLVLTSILILTPLTAAPLIGLVYGRDDVRWNFQSNYVRGGGAARIFAQDDPPVSLGSESMSNYISWAMGLANEPLPDSRNYMVDRGTLARVGNATVNAVYAKLDVDCHGFPLTRANTTEKGFAYFQTNMKKHNLDGRAWNNSERVRIKLIKGLAIWADDFAFVNRNTSSIDMVFAAINGSIEGGTTTNLTIPQSTPDELPISAVNCKVAVELMDKVLQIGKGGPPLSNGQEMTSVSSVDTIHIEFANSTDPKSPENTLNENALWFAAAPMVVCPSVEGAMPIYTREEDRGTSRLPVPYTNGPFRTDAPEHDNLDHSWTIDTIKHFVNVSVGAVSQACARNFQSEQLVRNATVQSQQYTRKLVPWRVVYLVIPFGVMFLGTIALFALSVFLYKKERILYMRMAPITEVITHHHQTLATSTALEHDGASEAAESPPHSPPPAHSSRRFLHHSMRGSKSHAEESIVELHTFDRSSSEEPHEPHKEQQLV